MIDYLSHAPDDYERPGPHPDSASVAAVGQLRMLTRFVILSIAAILLAALVLVGAAVTKAVAHDIYNGVRDHRGTLCCGGDPVTGDCERLESEQIVMRRDGSARIFSKRYKAWIVVGADIILPAAVPGDAGAAGHYCGVPREAAGRLTDAPTADQPDAKFITRCTFVAPGGA